jgi:membrane protein required for colicin V production
LSKIDIALSILFLVGGYLGYRRGFLAELFFLSALILGVFVGFKFTGWGVEFLHKELNADTAFLPYLSFFLIFILVVLVVIFIGNRIKHLMDDSFLGKVDALMGAALGALKYAFCASVVLWLAKEVNFTFSESWTRGSWLYPWTVSFASHVANFFGSFIPFFKEIFRQF